MSRSPRRPLSNKDWPTPFQRYAPQKSEIPGFGPSWDMRCWFDFEITKLWFLCCVSQFSSQLSLCVLQFTPIHSPWDLNFLLFAIFLPKEQSSAFSGQDLSAVVRVPSKVILSIHVRSQFFSGRSGGHRKNEKKAQKKPILAYRKNAN